MIEISWLSDQLCEVLRWQVVNPSHAGAVGTPEIPMAGRRVWGIFLQLHSRRAAGMGPSPITMGDIEAFSRVRRDPVRPWEIDIVLALDAAWLEATAAKDQPGNAVRPAISRRPLSPGLFDAIFAGG